MKLVKMFGANEVGVKFESFYLWPEGIEYIHKFNNDDSVCQIKVIDGKSFLVKGSLDEVGKIINDGLRSNNADTAYGEGFRDGLDAKNKNS